MTRLHLTLADSSARLEGLLMRWPTSPRLRRALDEARKREANQRQRNQRTARRARQSLIQAIHARLTSADDTTLQRLHDELMEVGA